jgi:N-methylhydantoinase B
VWRGDEVINLPSTDVVPLMKGDIVELSVGGGAGWGAPEKRSPERIATDLADGLITREFAERHYSGLF